MDIVFNCPQCKQEIAVEEAAAGVEIECPACGEVQLIPEAKPPASPESPPPPPPPPPYTPTPAPAEGGAAPAPTPAPETKKEHKPLAVPQHEGPSTVLVKKKSEATEAETHGPPKLRIRCIKRIACVEVGHDRFDEKVTDFFEKVGRENIVSIHPVSYGAMDTSGHIMPDYGIMIIYTG